MIRLLFVGDGERDAATNPHLVEKIVGDEVEPTARPWARLHGAARRYSRKLLFAIREARAVGLDGVVATVDQDKSRGRERLRELEGARDKDRETGPPLPTAVGCAKPHAEAWLLDDPVAVRRVLGLPGDAEIPNVRHTVNPKGELARLHSSSPRADEPAKAILVQIAQDLDVGRCGHARETGLSAFVDDVRREIGPLASRS